LVLVAKYERNRKNNEVQLQKVGQKRINCSIWFLMQFFKHKANLRKNTIFDNFQEGCPYNKITLMQRGKIETFIMH
jgi:hypothetical protein